MKKSWRYAYRDIIPENYLNAIPEWESMACVEDGQFIGTSSLCKSRFTQYPEAGEMISICFLPEYTKKGYGKALMQAVISEPKKQGSPGVILPFSFPR